jgi:hypothetical protein
MANTVISLRSSGVTGNTPSLGVLANGELSLNFADGILYYKSAANTLGSIRTTQPTGLNQEIQFNDSGSFGANAAFTFNKAIATLNVTNINTSSLVTGGGSGGIIAGANVIYANTFVANTGGYIQFADGSKQYTANAGSGGSSVTSVAGATGDVSNTQILTGLLTVDGTGSGLDADLLDGLNSSSFANTSFAQAAFDKANTDATNVNITSGTFGNSTYTPIVTVAANGRITDISTIATSGGGGSYTLPIASDSTLGGIKVGSGLNINAISGVLEATSAFPLIDLGSVIDNVTAYNILDLGTSF